MSQYKFHKTRYACLLATIWHQESAKRFDSYVELKSCKRHWVIIEGYFQIPAFPYNTRIPFYYLKSGNYLNFFFLWYQIQNLTFWSGSYYCTSIRWIYIAQELDVSKILWMLPESKKETIKINVLIFKEVSFRSKFNWHNFYINFSNTFMKWLCTNRCLILLKIDGVIKISYIE